MLFLALKHGYFFTEQGTSCGAKLEILAEKVPVGWGELFLTV